MKLYKTIVSLSIVGILLAPVAFAATPSATPTPTAAVENKVEYALPYPGILPDHPLYFIKKFRDMLMEKLIADPVRKVEFYVLQADKNMNMGIFLAAKQKNSLAIETMTIAQKRMEMALASAMTLKQDGKEVPSNLIEKLTNALDKHKEIIREFQNNETNTQKEVYDSLVATINKLQEDVGKLKE